MEPPATVDPECKPTPVASLTDPKVMAGVPIDGGAAVEPEDVAGDDVAGRFTKHWMTVLVRASILEERFLSICSMEL